MSELNRRTVVIGAAWSIPVILASIATPLAAASSVERVPIRIDYLDNYGGGGPKGGAWWLVTYSDGSTATLDNGTVMSDPVLKAMAKKVRR